MDCYGWPRGPYQVNNATFVTDDPFVAFVIYPNNVFHTSGSTTVRALWDSWFTAGQICDQWNWASGWCEVPVCTYEQITGSAQASVTTQAPPHIDSITPSRGVEDATTRVTISGAGFAAGPASV